MPSSVGINSDSGWEDRHRWYIAVVIALLICTALTAIGFYLIPRLFNKDVIFYSSPEVFLRQTCKAPACKRFADIMNQSMKLSANPCHDFYQYTCGNVSLSLRNLRTRLARQEALSEISSTETASNLTEGSARMKTFQLYHSCLKDTSNADTLYVKSFVGGYDLMLGSDNSSQEDPLEVMFTMASLIQDGIMIHLGMDYKHTSKANRMPFDHPLRLSINPVLKAWAKFGLAEARKKTEPLNIVMDVLQLVWDAMSHSQSFSETANEILSTETEVHVQINKFFAVDDSSKDFTTVIRDIGSLSRRLKPDNLIRYLSVDGTNYTADTEITVDQGILKLLDAVFSTIHVKKVATYISWELGRQLSMYIFDESTSQDHPSVCLSMIETLLGAGATYGPLTFRYVTDRERGNAMEIFQYIRAVTAESIRYVTGRNVAEKAHLESIAGRLESSRFEVVYPNALQNEAALDAKLAPISVSNESFIENYLVLSEAMWRRTKEYGVPDWLEWTELSAKVIYTPGKLLRAPATYLMPPLFSLEGLRATNLGTFGWSIAEIIWHVLEAEDVELIDQNTKSYMADVYSSTMRCLKHHKSDARYVRDAFHAMAMDSLVNVFRGTLTGADAETRKATMQLLFVSACLEDCGVDADEASKLCNVAAMNMLGFARAFECSDMGKPGGNDADCEF